MAGGQRPSSSCVWAAASHVGLGQGLGWAVLAEAQACCHAGPLADCRLPPLPPTHPPNSRRCPTAQAAAEALVLEAQAQWAVKFAGAHCDDITVAAAFLPAA